MMLHDGKIAKLGKMAFKLKFEEENERKWKFLNISFYFKARGFHGNTAHRISSTIIILVVVVVDM